MIHYHAKSSKFDIKKLYGEYCCSKKRSYGQKISNLTFFLIKKRCMASKIIMILTYIIVMMLNSLLVFLSIILILLFNKNLLKYKLYIIMYKFLTI